MLTFLFRFSAETWVEFDESTWNKLVDNSFKKPIFALCYSPYCPHCHGLPEGFKRYHEGLGNRSDIYIMTIDCTSSTGCAKFHIRGTPTIALVIGNNCKYWPRSPERGPEGWDRWINQTMNSDLRQIYNDSQLVDAQFEPKDGGSTFYVEVPSESHSILDTFRNHSRYFKIFNDTFVYKVNTSLTEPKIYAFQKPGCPIEFNLPLSNLYEFFNEYKFGVLHQYTYAEFLAIPYRFKVGLYVVKEFLKPVMKYNLQMAAYNECSRVVYGWASLNENSEFSKYIGTSTAPVMTFIDRRTSQYTQWKKAIKRVRKELLPMILDHKTDVEVKGSANKNDNNRQYHSASIILGAFAGIIIYIIAFWPRKMGKGSIAEKISRI